MFVSELYDGSLSSIKDEMMSSKNKLKIISMLFQVIYACLFLENDGLVHGDLHTGNVLYKNLDENDTFIYEVDGENFEIGTYGKLWILWDFGNMVENGQTINLNGEQLQAKDTVQTDIAKLSMLLSLRNKSLFSPLVDIIEGGGKCIDLLRYLRDLYVQESIKVYAS